MGKGETDEGVVIGGVVSIVVTVCFLLCGLPMMIAGIVLIKVFNDDYWYTDLDLEDDDIFDETNDIFLKVGIALIVISGIFLIAGIAIAIAICVCGKKNKQNNQMLAGGVVINPPPAYGNPQGYPGQQPQGYPGQQQQGYPGQQPQGYPGQQPQGYAYPNQSYAGQQPNPVGGQAYSGSGEEKQQNRY